MQREIVLLLLLLLAGCSGDKDTPNGSGVVVSCMDTSTAGSGACSSATAKPLTRSSVITGLNGFTSTTTFYSGDIHIQNSELPITNMIVSNNTGSTFNGYWIVRMKPAYVDLGWCIGLIISMPTGTDLSFTVGTTYTNAIPFDVELSQSVYVYEIDPARLPFASGTYQQDVNCWATGTGYDVWTAEHDMSSPVAIGINYFTYVP